MMKCQKKSCPIEADSPGTYAYICEISGQNYPALHHQHSISVVETFISKEVPPVARLS